MKMWNKKSLSQSKLDEFIVGKDRYYDLFLTQYDCKASIAHVRMLEKIGVYNKNESKKVILELKKIILDSKKENFILEDKFEDIHSKIEFIITEKYGDLGKKIHTGRSRNDQVLVAIQLYLKKELNEIKYLTKDLFDILLNLENKRKIWLKQFARTHGSNGAQYSRHRSDDEYLRHVASDV